jgi:hypothetical protein
MIVEQPTTNEETRNESLCEMRGTSWTPFGACRQRERMLEYFDSGHL